MSNAVDVYLCTSATDVNSAGAFAQQGDLLLNLATLQLYCMLPGGPTAVTSPVTTKAANVAALSSVGPGTPAAGLVDVGAAFAQATLNNNFATLGTEVNAIRAALVAAGLMVGP